MEPTASAIVWWGVPGLAALVWGLVVAGAWRAGGARLAAILAIGAVAVVSVVSVLARSGVLADFERRPPIVMPLMAGTAILTLVAAFSPVGKAISKLPLSALVALQGFRLPLELVMHQAAREGVMPAQMSYSGWNFDIVSGATALVVAALLATGRAPRALVLGWNVLGSLLLAAVVLIAIASTPVFHAFGADPRELNTWVAYFPFVCLPFALVPAAIFGHAVIFRAILKPSEAPTSLPARPPDGSPPARA